VIDTNLIRRPISQDVCWEELGKAKLRKPFDADSIQFCQLLSQSLLRPAITSAFPELAALGFWLRKSNLMSIAESVSMEVHKNGTKHYVNPRGTVFHIAPANVDTIFVYSWILSLLCGNRNLIRLSSKTSPQLSTLLQLIDEILCLESSSQIRQSIAMVQYERSEEITARLCEAIDVRIIWGGDDTVNAIRKIPVPPTATEACFPNKVSFACIDVKSWRQISSGQKHEVASAFVKDAYPFLQSACSSPRGLVWVGENVDSAEKESFWQLVLEVLRRESFEFSDIDFVDKRIACDIAATQFPIRVPFDGDNRLVRIVISPDDFRKGIESELHCGRGLFFETNLASLMELPDQLSRKTQTVSYLGFEQGELSQLLEVSALGGIDRIVPFGRALDFSHMWDGINLLDVFLRTTTFAQTYTSSRPTVV
jgi:hypothetical protein